MELLITVVVIIFILASAVKIVRPVEQGIVEFLGKYSRTAGAGLIGLFLVFIECIKLI